MATEHYSTTVQGGSITDQLRGGGVVLRRSRGALVVQVARCLASFSKIPREDPVYLVWSIARGLALFSKFLVRICLCLAV